VVAEPTCHAILIGCDSYPPGFPSLSGCANDVRAFEALLSQSTSVRVTRLVGGDANRHTVLATLRKLTGDEIGERDRILIYYSGHGDRKRWEGSPTWHEALALSDGESIGFIFDVELSVLLGAMCERTPDVTVILDCCHSAGATRAIVEPLGRDRFLGTSARPTLPPDAEVLRAVSNSATSPAYVGVAACSAVETAGEGGLGDEPSMGILTYALISVLESVPVQSRPELRWIDLWADLVDAVAARCTALRRRAQHPRLIGRPERRLFGGVVQEHAVGPAVRRGPDASYVIDAGTLVGMRDGAIIGVYGQGSGARIGVLRVVAADRDRASAVQLETAFELPAGATVRLISAAADDRLRVAVDPRDTLATRTIAESGLLRPVAAGDPNAEATVTRQSGGGWSIGSDVHMSLAVVPGGYVQALRAGLEHYAHSAAVLRMAQTSNLDPPLAHRLDLALYDCRRLPLDGRADLVESDLVEAPREDDGVYAVPSGFPFCIGAATTFPLPLQIAVINCAGGGEMEYLGDTTLSPGDHQLLWLNGVYGRPFIAEPDAPEGGLDRLLAVATTDLATDFSYLHMPLTIQEVVNQATLRGSLPTSTSSMPRPNQLWTAVVCPLRIRPLRRA
jgi:caspase domain-containing protein